MFADKTGTLTCNEMIVRTVSVGGQVYGKIPDIAKESMESDENDKVCLCVYVCLASMHSDCSIYLNLTMIILFLTTQNGKDQTNKAFEDEELSAILKNKQSGKRRKPRQDQDLIRDKSEEEEEEEGEVKEEGAKQKHTTSTTDDQDQVELVKHFFTALSVCHTVFPKQTEEDQEQQQQQHREEPEEDEGEGERDSEAMKERREKKISKKKGTKGVKDVRISLRREQSQEEGEEEEKGISLHIIQSFISQ